MFNFFKPERNYLKIRPSNAFSEEYSHIWLLLYWVVFGIVFSFIERIPVVDVYYPMYCILDDFIPFNEFFIFPYMFWFIYLAGMVAFTFFYDVAAFRKMMKFIIITYTVTVLIYIIFPNCQYLRPKSFERDNALVDFMKSYYRFDTNTNVCPSLHVIGSFASFFAALDCKHFCRSKGWKLFFGISCALISISTVFLKQHSIIDVFAGVVVCYFAYILTYKMPFVKIKMKHKI